MRWNYGFSMLLLSVSQALAVTANSDADSFNGFYGGISGGASLISSKSSTVATGTFDFRPQAFLEQTSVNAQNQSQTTAPKGSIFMGFGHTWQTFYLSAELFTNLSRYNMQTSAYSGLLQPEIANVTTSENTSIELNPAEYSVDLRPGMLLTSGALL